MKKRMISLFLLLALSFSLSVSVFAVDDCVYYSLPPVAGSEPFMANLNSVKSSVFDNNDSNTLTNIYKYIQYLTLTPASWQSNSLIGFLEKIYNRIPANLSTNFALVGGDGTNSILDDIRKWTMFSYNYLSSTIAGNLGNIQRNTLSSADRLLSLVTAVSGIDDYATEKTLVSFFDNFRLSFGTDSYISPTQTWQYLYSVGWDSENQKVLYGSFGSVLWNFSQALGYYGTNLFGVDTLYTRIAKLQETLASDDDRQLAQNYKDNREQAEQDFLSGKSGKTSLGKGDFSNASKVGGALNDTFNMGGASKVSDFVSGFGSAGQESLSWFSDTTANNLDSVTSARNSNSFFSLFTDVGETTVDFDPDPYNMDEISGRYEWLPGVFG